jgi:hypothetical protein
VPGAAFETVAGAGHFPHIEQAKRFAERALAFADRQPAANGAARTMGGGANRDHRG